MIIPVGYAQVSHFFGGVAAPNGAAITYGISGFGTLTGPEAANLLHDLFDLNWSAVLSSELQLLSTRLKYGPNATGPFYEHTELQIMEASGPAVPPNTAVLVEKQTALGGRAGRGRMYIPGCSESNVNGSGALTSAAVTFFTTAAQSWLEDIETNFTSMVLFHTASSDPTNVTDLQIDPITATQRRRLR